MRLTVAICTRNRAASLARTLTSLQEVTRPPDVELEILVVNNGCTDDTDAVITRFATLLPLCGVWQPEPGLSRARNAAIDAATGDYMIWTDDDVLLDHGWLLGYEQAFRAHPEAVFFGGPIEPVFEGGMPEWIRAGWRYLTCVYAERKLGTASFHLDRAMPFGANMAIRMAEQRAHRYDVKLGRQPGPILVSGEETAVFRALLARGKHGWWVPEARVQHCISAERQTLEYIRAYFEGQGFEEAMLQPPPAVFLALLCRVALLAAYCRILQWGGRSEQWLPVLIKAAKARGMLAQTMVRS